MKWKTSISKRDGSGHTIRGIPHDELIENHTFTEVLYLLFCGRLPSESEDKLLNAILVSIIEHGVEVPTAFVPRTSASVGNEMHTALASGVLSVGPYHGGAIESSMRMLTSAKEPAAIVEDYTSRNDRIPGLGHKIYKDEDPRATLLFKKAKSLGLSDTYEKKYRAVKDIFYKKTKKELPINVDGAIAALLLELGCKPEFGNALFVLARMPSMAAHIAEEMEQSSSYRRIDEEDVEYTD